MERYREAPPLFLITPSLILNLFPPFTSFLAGVCVRTVPALCVTPITFFFSSSSPGLLHRANVCGSCTAPFFFQGTTDKKRGDRKMLFFFLPFPMNRREQTKVRVRHLVRHNQRAAFVKEEATTGFLFSPSAVCVRAPPKAPLMTT